MRLIRAALIKVKIRREQESKYQTGAAHTHSHTCSSLYEQCGISKSFGGEPRLTNM